MADNNTINNITEPWDGHSFKEVEEFIKEELETIPTVPTNVSVFTNDADYSTKEYVDEKVGVKQDWLVSGRNIRTVNGSSLLGEGNIVIPKGQDGKDAVNPFKGWFESADNLPSSPQNGDYAYVKVRINSVDYVHIFTYDESAPNHWSDTGREVDTSGIYTFYTEEILNQVSIVNDLETGGAHNVLSAQQGVSIKEDINELSDKWIISENLSKRVADNDDPDITYAVKRGFFRLSDSSAILYPFTAGETLWKPLSEARYVNWVAYRVEPGSYIKVTQPEGETLNEGYICVLSAIPNHDYNDSTLPVSFSKGWAEENRIMFKINDKFGSYSFKLPDLYIDTEQPVNSETDMFLYVTTHGAGSTTVYNGIYWMYSGDGTNASELNERISALENGLPEGVLTTEDIIDNLTTNDNTKVLSASQGNVIGSRLNDIEEKFVVEDYEILSDKTPNNDDPNMDCLSTYYVLSRYNSKDYPSLIRSKSSQDDDSYQPTVSYGWYRNFNLKALRIFKVRPGATIKVKPTVEGNDLNSYAYGHFMVLNQIQKYAYMDEENYDHNIHYSINFESTLPSGLDSLRFGYTGTGAINSYEYTLPLLSEDEDEMFLYVRTDVTGYNTGYKYYMCYGTEEINLTDIYEKIDKINGEIHDINEKDYDDRITSLENKWEIENSVRLYTKYKDSALGNSDVDYTDETMALATGYIRTCSSNESNDDKGAILYQSSNKWVIRQTGRKWIAFRVTPLSTIRLYRDSDRTIGYLWILNKIEHTVNYCSDGGIEETSAGCNSCLAHLSMGYNDSNYQPGAARFKINEASPFITVTDSYYEFQLPDLAEGEEEMWLYMISHDNNGVLQNVYYHMITYESLDVSDVYNDINTVDNDLSVLEERVDNLYLNTGTDTYFDSDARNLNILDSIGNPLRPLEYDLYKSITLETTADPRFYEVYPQTLQHKALYDLGRVMSYIKWKPKKMETGADGYRMPVTDGFKQDGYYNGYWYGIPYTSVKENDKYVGFDVSIYTFMTAVNNPFSLLYTEITRGDYSRSAWGNTYYGINCATYYGITCSELTSMLSGLPTGYSTDMQSWLYKNGNKLAKVYPQEYEYLQPGDILVCYNNSGNESHCRMVAGIEREPIDATTQNPKSNGRVTALDIVHGSGTHCATFRRANLTYKTYMGVKYMKPDSDYAFVIAYRSIEKYKNLALYNSFNEYDKFYDTSKILLNPNIGSYNDYYITSTGQSSWVDTYKRNLIGFNNEQTNFLNAPQKVYEYNNYICTYAGDKACFNQNDLVVVNYNLDDTHSFDPADIVFVKDDVNITDSVKYPTELDMDNALQAKQINHAIKVVDDNGEGFGPGTYSATITVEEDGENVDYVTQWEVIETNNVQLQKDLSEKDMVNITFGFSNGIPFAISVGLQNGHKLLLRELTEDEVLNRNIKTNLKRLAKEQTGDELEGANKNLLYFKMFFRGEFGVAIGKQPCGFLFE